MMNIPEEADENKRGLTRPSLHNGSRLMFCALRMFICLLVVKMTDSGSLLMDGEL